VAGAGSITGTYTLVRLAAERYPELEIEKMPRGGLPGFGGKGGKREAAGSVERIVEGEGERMGSGKEA
jgi:hypothetical protein